MNLSSTPPSFLPNERDTRICLFVHDYDGVGTEHLQRRFFPTPAGMKVCYKRISRLAEEGFVVQRRTPSATGVGSGPYLILLGARGRRLVAEVLGLTRSDLERVSRSHSPQVVPHHFAICDTRLSVELAAERSAVFSVRDWTTERNLKRTPLKVKDPTSNTTTAICADGAFTLALPDGTTQRFLLEQDRGTLVSLERVHTKFGAYLRRPGEHREPILVVTTTPRRQAAIATWVTAQAKKLGADPTMFWITTSSRLNEATVLAAPIWQVAGGPAAIALEALVRPQHESAGNGFASGRVVS